MGKKLIVHRFDMENGACRGSNIEANSKLSGLESLSNTYPILCDLKN